VGALNRFSGHGRCADRCRDVGDDVKGFELAEAEVVEVFVVAGEQVSLVGQELWAASRSIRGVPCLLARRV
jgi:hypothetical protein